MAVLPVLYTDLLADRKLKPAAIRLRFGAGDLNTLAAMLGNEDLMALTAAIPCLIDAQTAARLPEHVQQLLQTASCRQVADEAIARNDALGEPTLPGTAHWLVGDWDQAPPVKSTGKQTASRATSLRLLQCVTTDADTCEIEAFFRQDPVLAYHLLRLVNSLAISGGRAISSFAQAILVLGRQQLKRWLNLMLFAASRDDHRSSMLLARTTLRARRTELLARACGFDRSAQERAFLAGMFSLLGVLFGQPLADVLAPLKLSAVQTGAILEHTGELGQLLLLAECSERADEPGVLRLLDEFKLPEGEFNAISIEACLWMLGVVREGGIDD